MTAVSHRFGQHAFASPFVTALCVGCGVALWRCEDVGNLECSAVFQPPPSDEAERVWAITRSLACG